MSRIEFHGTLVLHTEDGAIALQTEDIPEQWLDQLICQQLLDHEKYDDSMIILKDVHMLIWRGDEVASNTGN